ncbi:MAG: tRNA lysidine(34) synthetase TilS [Actinobacteria bacterium]|nr:tRNA lysidine(34) synthetase TilS [Actinomycetota bacterium]
MATGLFCPNQTVSSQAVRLLEEMDSLARLPKAGEQLVCAVSGGADSLTLMLLGLWRGCKVTAIHVDHGLRQDSAQEALVVQQAAEQFGADFISQQVKVDMGPNLEARARQARLSVLPPDTATGHTMDDQAETVLINLLRGSGLDGLSAMRLGAKHPLLKIRRHQTQALCKALQLKPVVDPSNFDLSYLRNRIRNQLIPYLCELANRDIVPILARTADIMGEEADLLNLLAESLDPSDSVALSASSDVLSRRAIRQWLKPMLGLPPSYACVQRIVDVAKGKAKACEVVTGISVVRSKGKLYIKQSTQTSPVD